jgi:dienelactone hydrolase
MDEATAEYLLKGTNIPGVDNKNIRFQIKTHGVIGAQIAAGHKRFPVLIFSPGWGESYFVYQSILEDLASRGYIVVGVNSPNSAGITVFPDGHYHVMPTIDEKEEDQYLSKHFQEVADDLQFVAKQLSLIDSDRSLPLAGRIDLGRIGSFGHSYGGAAAVQVGIQSSQLGAAANLDGSLMGEDYKKTISKPMMMVWSEVHPKGDETMGMVWKNLHKGSYQVQVKGTDHMSFSDLMLIMNSMGLAAPQNPNPIDPSRGIQISRDTLRTFFDVNLKHANPNQMNKISRKYQEVKVEEKRAGK